MNRPLATLTAVLLAAPSLAGVVIFTDDGWAITEIDVVCLKPNRNGVTCQYMLAETVISDDTLFRELTVVDSPDARPEPRSGSSVPRTAPAGEGLCDHP